MPSTREQVLTALFDHLQLIAGGTVKRNEALPASVPAGEFYTHRAEIEAFVTQLVGGGGETALDALLSTIGIALAADRSLGSLAENLYLSAPEISVLAIEGGAALLTARVTVTIEYLVSDPLQNA